jgi:hypothetical protein
MQPGLLKDCNAGAQYFPACLLAWAPRLSRQFLVSLSLSDKLGFG